MENSELLALRANDLNEELYYILGYRYLHGEGVRKDLKIALYWFEKGAKIGCKYSQFQVGKRYRFEDKEKAIKLFTQSAEQGYVKAMFVLGEMYAYDLTHVEGEGYRKAKLLLWYKKAAERGYTKAMVRLGNMHFWGYNGVEQDFTQALRWYTKAAENGNKDGMERLFRFYSSHCYGEKNYRLSRFWKDKATEIAYEDDVYE